MKTKRRNISWMLLAISLIILAGCHPLLIPPNAPSSKIALKSYHGRYVTALGGDDGWSLRQEIELSDCGWFTLRHLTNGKTTLETCHGKYVTAPKTGVERRDWLFGQESKLGACGQFDLYELGDDRIAFKTCARRFLTAGDGGWEQGLEWSVIGETEKMEAWEIFTVQQ